MAVSRVDDAPPTACSAGVTHLLDTAAAGDRQAADTLLPLVYAELRRLAARRMAGERAGDTLDATGLVHEAYLQMNAVSLVARHIYDFEDKVWPEAAKNDVGLAAMKVFGGGVGGGPGNARLPERLRPAALRYALGLPQVSVVVVGIKSEAELKQNLAWAKAYKPLNKDELDELAAPTKELAKAWGELYGQVT